MMFRDDEIDRILNGATAPDPAAPGSEADDDVIAETVIRVDLGAALGYLELSVPDLPGTSPTSPDAIVTFLVPDGGYQDPTTVQKSDVTIRVGDLARVLAAMQTAIARAQSMGVLPLANGGAR